MDCLPPNTTDCFPPSTTTNFLPVSSTQSQTQRTSQFAQVKTNKQTIKQLPGKHVSLLLSYYVALSSLPCLHLWARSGFLQSLSCPTRESFRVTRSQAAYFCPSPSSSSRFVFPPPPPTTNSNSDSSSHPPIARKHSLHSGIPFPLPIHLAY